MNWRQYWLCTLVVVLVSPLAIGAQAKKAEKPAKTVKTENAVKAKKTVPAKKADQTEKTDETKNAENLDLENVDTKIDETWKPTDDDIDTVRTYILYLLHPGQKVLAREIVENNYSFKTVLETPEYSLARKTLDWLLHDTPTETAVVEAQPILKKYEDTVFVWVYIKWQAGARELTLPKNIYERIHLENSDGVEFPYIGVSEPLAVERTLNLQNYVAKFKVSFHRQVTVKDKKDRNKEKVVDLFKDSKEVLVHIDPIAPDFPRVTTSFELPIQYFGMFRGRPIPMIMKIGTNYEQANRGPQ